MPDPKMEANRRFSSITCSTLPALLHCPCFDSKRFFLLLANGASANWLSPVPEYKILPCLQDLRRPRELQTWRG